MSRRPCRRGTRRAAARFLRPGLLSCAARACPGRRRYARLSGNAITREVLNDPERTRTQESRIPGAGVPEPEPGTSVVIGSRMVRLAAAGDTGEGADVRLGGYGDTSRRPTRQGRPRSHEVSVGPLAGRGRSGAAERAPPRLLDGKPACPSTFAPEPTGRRMSSKTHVSRRSRRRSASPSTWWWCAPRIPRRMTGRGSRGRRRLHPPPRGGDLQARRGARLPEGNSEGVGVRSSRCR